MDQNVKAGFWIRSAAHAVDVWLFLVLWIVLMFFCTILGGILAASLKRGAGIMMSAFAGILSLLLVFVANGFYYVLMTKNDGQTLGKKLVGIRVTQLEGGPINLKQSIFRWMGYFLSYVTLYIGYILAGVTSQKRALHDYVAKTQVVRVASCPKWLQIGLIVVGMVPTLLPLIYASAVVIPTFYRLKQMVVRAQETSTHAGLQTLRSATQIYYMKMGEYPENLKNASFLGEYILEIPPVTLGKKGHPISKDIEISALSGSDIEDMASQLKDTGHWIYDPQTGRVIVDCTHQDTRGQPIYSW